MVLLRVAVYLLDQVGLAVADQLHRVEAEVINVLETFVGIVASAETHASGSLAAIEWVLPVAAPHHPPHQ